MSIKIYTGYKLPHLGLLEIKKFCDTIKEDFTKKRNTFIKNNWDRNDYMSKVFLPHTRDEMGYSFEASIDFFPHEKYIFCITNFPRIYDGIFEKYEIVEEYGYWDNVDQLESCTDEEWADRRDTWEIIYPDFSSPSQNAFHYTILGKLLPMPDKIYIDEV